MWNPNNWSLSHGSIQIVSASCLWESFINSFVSEAETAVCKFSTVREWVASLTLMLFKDLLYSYSEKVSFMIMLFMLYYIRLS